MASVGGVVDQKVCRCAHVGNNGWPWRIGCPQVGPRGAQVPKIGPEATRARPYAQCGFGDMSGLKRNMFRHVCLMVCNFHEETSKNANIKLLKNVGKMRQS